ncbi:hypothetical protein B9Z19DRAFT_1094740, partial [Tuber borchii]
MPSVRCLPVIRREGMNSQDTHVPPRPVIILHHSFTSKILRRNDRGQINIPYSDAKPVSQTHRCKQNKNSKEKLTFRKCTHETKEKKRKKKV